jgi:hypothetical protein
MAGTLARQVNAEVSSPQQTRLALTSAPYHIATWAYDEFKGQGSQASPDDVVRLLSYAETGPGNQKALLDCHSVPNGCKAVLYFDPNKAYDSPNCPYKEDSDLLFQANETWFVHQVGTNDSAHRVHGTYYQNCHGVRVPINVWAINISSPAVQTYFRNFLQRAGDSYDLYYIDDMQADIPDQFYFSGKGGCDETGRLCRSIQEYAQDSDLQRAAASFVRALTHRNGSPMEFIFNSLTFNGKPVADMRLLDASPQFVGASCEGCATSGETLHPNNYERILNTMAQFVSRSRIFVLLSYGNAPSGSAIQIQQRLVTTALIWLGYKDKYTVVWPDLESNTKNLAVWPEDMIYPSQPVQTMSSGAPDLQVTPKVWRREFAACYFRGVLFGRCAAILNGEDSDVVVQSSWLSDNYGHVIGVTGGDELSGGTISLSGARFIAGQTEVPAHQALLLTP